MSKALLLKFRETDTGMGVSRNTLKEISENLGVSETMAVHIALARLRRDLFDIQADGDEFDFPSKKTMTKHDRSGKAHGAVVRKKSITDQI